MKYVPKSRSRILYRPFCEPLEDRLVPAGPTVTPPGSQTVSEATSAIFQLGSFSEPGNNGPWQVDVNWGDNTADSIFAATSQGSIASQSHTYDDAATYMATVTVSDNTSGTGSAKFVVTVNPVPPAAAILGVPSTNPAEGAVVTLSGSATSVSSLDTVEGFSFSWTVTKSGITVQTGTGNTFGLNLNQGRGNYVVSLVATENNDPTTSSLPATVTIQATGVAPTPTITGAPATSPAGTSISLGSTVTDPNVSNNATLKESITYQWAVTTPNGLVGTQTGATTPNFSFTPNQPGTYFVTLTVSDQESPPDVGTTTQTIVVTNVGPVVTPPGTQPAPEGQLTTFNLGSFTDPFAQPPWTVDVDWGDNTPHTTFTVNSPGPIPSQVHTYGSEGTFTLTITVTESFNPDTVGLTAAPSQAPSATATASVIVGGFVTSLYQDVLGRAPDAPGLQSWVALHHAGVSREAIATGFWLSPEHRGLEVDQFYAQILHRSADPLGRASWVNALEMGVSEANVVAAFFTSAEFQATHPDPGSFVNALFPDVLGRPATPAEVASLSRLIDNGPASRTQLVLTVLSFDETYTAALNDYYNHFLDRAASAAELQGWLTLLRTGLLNSTNVATMFLGSPEYLQRALFEATFLPPPP
jgi:hypothetical protein